jgi:hypothetical protein
MGVILAYFLDGGINKPELVFTGAAFAAVAVGLGAAAHVVTQLPHNSSVNKDIIPPAQKLAQQQQQQQQRWQGLAPEDSAHGLAAGRKQYQPATTSDSSSSSSSRSKTPDADVHCEDSGRGADCEMGALGSMTRGAAASKQQQQQQQQNRSVTASRKASLYLGLFLSVVGEDLGDSL